MFFLINFVYNFIFNCNDSAFCIYWRFNMEQSNSEVIIIGFSAILIFYITIGIVFFFQFFKKERTNFRSTRESKKGI